MDDVEISKCARQNMERNRHDCQDYTGDETTQEKRESGQNTGMP